MRQMTPSEKRHRERMRRKKRNAAIRRAVFFLLICVILAGAAIYALFSCMDKGNDSKGEKKEKAKAEEPAKIEPVTITIGSAGDIILHRPFIESSTYKDDGDYDYSPCFKFIESRYKSYDYMVANLETTLAGKDNGYRGYPTFNSPDEISKNLTENGVNLLLLANNHIYDSGKSGFLRTASILDEYGYQSTGAVDTDSDKRYVIQDIKGIKVGFINYTYETPYDGGKAVNANHMDSEVAGYLNSFDPNHLDSFYEEFAERVQEMKNDGAEFIIFYPHWGNEYQLEECSYQREMAQKCCDMGVDAIIGGHPHVVQPVDVFTSSDGTHKTFCAFSMGNQLSNQRRAYVPLQTGNTEDGIIVGLEITKNEKGQVSLTGVKCTPTWVYMANGPAYYIIPADDPDSVQEETGLDGIKSEVKASADRTDKIISEGMKKVNQEFLP